MLGSPSPGPVPGSVGHALLFAAACLAAACSSPIVKSRAFFMDSLRQAPLPAERLSQADEEELVVQVGPEWLATDARSGLVFARYRDVSGYCVLLECAPKANRLVLLPLEPDETPLSVLGDEDRRLRLQEAVDGYPDEAPEGAVDLALDEVYEKGLLGSPLPKPRRILGVAFNFPSHLEVDLDIPRDLHEEIRGTPPRLFWKYPPVPPPGSELDPAYSFTGVIGPFDTLRYPVSIQLPQDETGESQHVPANLDYEVEIGVVLGRALTWDDVEDATDAELLECIAGYVLVSDVKARNPQVYERALSRDDSPDVWSAKYLTGVGSIDLLLGNWDEATCAWWGYAASLGEIAAIGPWFVAKEGGGPLRPRAVAAARTYGDPQVRGASIPDDRVADRFYLRQCSVVTEDGEHPECMLWSVPSLLRGALDPEGALTFPGERRLDRGDVIALGTPGGIVLTVANRVLYDWLDFFLFWWDARDWHDAFFERDLGMYLRNGDRVFLWGEGLGCQELEVEMVVGDPVKEVPGEPATGDDK